MRKFPVAVWAEMLKVRKSRVFPATLLFIAFVASMMGLFMFVQMYPDISGKLGMIGDKASMMQFGEPGWASFSSLRTQVFAGVGLVGMGFVTSWVFGREFSDHTIKDILTIPVSRVQIVLAKSLVIVLWSVILSLVFLASGLVIGLLIGLPGLSAEILKDFALNYTITSLLTMLLFTPVALLASYSRGFILPLAFVILTMIMANFSGLVGLGPYFPWAIPGLYGVSSENHEMQLNFASYAILLMTCITGLIGTVYFWRWADHK
jgi:ABC-type transport system involved in multi-copper enzyme maturation permease subunit